MTGGIVLIGFKIRKASTRGVSPVAISAMIILAALVAAALLINHRNNPGEQVFSYHYLAMDTSIDLRLQAQSRQEAEAARDELFAEIKRLEKLFSRTLSGSDISMINKMAGKEAVEVSPETLELIYMALDFALLSEGAFDPTIAPLLDLWGFLGSQYRLPGSQEIEAALHLADYRLLQLDRENRIVFLPQNGMALDLGGIAKGYIVDRGLKLLSEAGIDHALLNAGGDIGILGSRPDGTPWRIGVRHPRREDQYIAVLPLSGGAVVTSGDYERVFEEGGRRYHHILDPETGQPAHSLASVTIIAPTAVKADALSTAVFVMGAERGLALVERLPDIEAILVTTEMEILASTGLQELI